MLRGSTRRSLHRQQDPAWMGQAGIPKGYPMQTSDVLNRAADHIQEHGHRKGGLGGLGEPTCAIGAIRAVAVGDWISDAVPLLQYLGEDIAAWNNAPDRTAAEVIETLRACAVIEASRERQPAEVSA